jgi:hypothetical protein
LISRWLNPVLSSGSKRPLNDLDFYKTLPHEESKKLTDDLEMYAVFQIEFEN